MQTQMMKDISRLTKIVRLTTELFRLLEGIEKGSGLHYTMAKEVVRVLLTNWTNDLQKMIDEQGAK